MKTFSRIFKPSHASYCRPLSIFLTAAIAGCSPAKNNHVVTGSAMKISNVAASTADCEMQIRAKMLTRAFQMQAPAAMASQIAAINKQIPQLTDPSYNIGQQSNENTSIGVTFEPPGSAQSPSLAYSLSLNDEDSAAAMNLSIEYQSADSNKAIDITQSFSVDNSCALTLTQTKAEIIEKQSSTQFTDTLTNYYIDGGTDNKTTPFSIPAGNTLSNFVSQTDLKVLAQYPYNWMSEVGLTVVKYSPQADGPMNVFGKSTTMNIAKIDISSDGKVIMSGTLALNAAKGLQSFEIEGQQSWTVSKDIWDQQVLGTSRNFNSYVVDNLSIQNLESSSAYNLVAEKPLAYDHAAAYWSIKGTRQKDSSGHYQYLLIEKNPPITSGGTGPADLASNDTIQTHLPQVKAIAKDILAKAPTDKQMQVQLILDYLQNHYSFDTDMVSENVVRPLTTAEALARGKGVCQHYSVIFTAIARAVGIPTRIVAGYHLDDKAAGGHAWVEVSMTRGQWQVIEPQNDQALTTTYTRQYLPVGRATFLEDKNASQAEFIEGMTTHYEFDPF